MAAAAPAPAALPAFPPGHIPFNELVPGTIYKYVAISAVGNYRWGFARFIRSVNRHGNMFSQYGTWITDPNPALAAPLYMELVMRENTVKFYPIDFDTGAMPRLPQDVNPPDGEITSQLSRSAGNRRMHALAAWSLANPPYNSRRRTNRRRSNRRRSSRRHSRK